MITALVKKLAHNTDTKDIKIIESPILSKSRVLNFRELNFLQNFYLVGTLLPCQNKKEKINHHIKKWKKDLHLDQKDLCNALFNYKSQL